MRTILIRLESPWKRALVATVTLAVAGLIGVDVVRRAVADGLGSSAETVEDFERAVAWDPRNPDLHLKAADAHIGAATPDGLARAREHLEAALRGRPTHAGTWLRLAHLEDRSGRRDVARERLATAVRLDRHSVGLRWEAALLSLRWGDREAALEHFRYVLRVDPERRDAAFQLARTLLAPGEPVSSLLPAEAEPLGAILAVAIRDRDVELASAAWERRTTLTPAVTTDLQRQFLDLLLAEGEGTLARRVWAGIAPTEGQAEPTNAVWNGSFEAPRLLGWGFDWQVRRVWGVETRLDTLQVAEGRRSLRLDFNSFPTLDYAGVSQVVALEPGRRYRLQARVKATNFVTRSGLKLQVTTHDSEMILAETAPVAGTTEGWVPIESTFVVPEAVSLVRVRLRRERAPQPEGNLGGKVWIDAVSLEPASEPGT